MTPKEFLLKKYPPDTFYDCPVPKEYWKDMQEFSDANNRQLVEQNKELLEALKPFAELSKLFDGTIKQRPTEGEIHVWVDRKGEHKFTVEMLKNAAAAIKNAETI